MTLKDERRATMRAEVRARRHGQSAPSEPPGAWAARGACNGQSSLFDDPTRTAEALAICATCLVLNLCKWACHNAVKGVAGGMASAARTAWRKGHKIAEPVVSIDDFLPAEVVVADHVDWLRWSDTILAAVARWTEDGDSARQIGERLGVTSRTVVRTTDDRMQVRAVAVGDEGAYRQGLEAVGSRVKGISLIPTERSGT